MEQEIIDGNILISKFMKWERDTSNWWCKPAYGDGFNPERVNYSSGVRFSDKHLEWNFNWSWLMPVVEKIESLTGEDGRGKPNYVVTIEPGYCVISLGGEDIIIDHQDHEIKKVEVVYFAVVEFIKWYNEQLASL